MPLAKLAKYRAKRDFKVTAEPSGDVAVAAAARRRFVIQKHAATRLHYDLRLEHEGVFLSWAVTRGPSLDPRDKRLAVEVEPHPLDYGDFEGTIPEGEYGGGTVMLWDRGYWAPEPGLDVARGLKAGELKLVFSGERMKGGWVLVKIRNDRMGAKRSNWLLIKHRDEFARAADRDRLLENAAFSVASGRTMEQIAAGEGEAPRPFIAKAPARTKLAEPRPKPTSGDNQVMGVTLSNPDKALWPDAGDERPVTKLDLARYYEAVADWMMPHIARRPCSTIRTPDGIGGDRFFQRHLGKGASALLGEVALAGDHKPYLVIDRKEALAALAQTATTELHPSNCRPGEPEVPGRLVFDLDPDEGLDFDDVIAAAREVEERLERLGLTAFCKTTGGKGLHVVTPLAKSRRGKLDWATAKGFAHELCTRMAADSPNRYVVNMSKKLRKGRIFLDYLRNDRLSTAVAPLSPRARPGATVSMPLTWSQVRAGLDPKRFTVRTAPALVAKMTAWEGYADSERSLEEAIRRHGGKPAA